MAAKNIQIHITSPDTFLDIDELELHIHKDGNIEKIPLVMIENIIIHEDCKLNSVVLRRCAEYEIDLRTADESGLSSGRWYHNKISPDDIIQYKQFLFLGSEEAKPRVIAWIQQKFSNQINFLERHLKRSKNQLDAFKTEFERCSKPEFDFLKHEAHLTKKYYSLFSQLLPKEFALTSRSRMPAMDPINSLINYSYSMLYSITEAAILRSGLSPYLGILHGIEKGGKAFLFDFIEPYRPWIDEKLYLLIRANKFSLTDFAISDHGCFISVEARKMLVLEIDQWMEETIQYSNRRLSRKNHINDQAERFAKEIKNIRIKPHVTKGIFDML